MDGSLVTMRLAHARRKVLLLRQCHNRLRTKALAHYSALEGFRTRLGNCLLMPTRMTPKASIPFRAVTTGTTRSTPRPSRSAPECPWRLFTHRSRPLLLLDRITAALKSAPRLIWLTRTINPQCLLLMVVRTAWPDKAQITRYRLTTDLLRARLRTWLCSLLSTWPSSRPCL